MKASLLLALVIGLLTSTLARLAAAEPSKPNIIVILADDLGSHDLSVQGCRDIPTPHLDSLAKNGVRCTQGYISAPVCSPSRAGLLTGRYQNRFGFEFLVSPDAVPLVAGEKIGLSIRERTFADRMKAVGYATGCIGKWHLGGDDELLPMARGFDEFYGSPGQSHYFTPLIIDSQKGTKPTKLRTPGYYLTDDFAEQAAGFVSRHKEKPFFLYLPHFAVHTPLLATEKYLARFATMPESKRRTYAAMVSALDDAVGLLLDTLRREGLEENTLIFFLSDNGGTGGVGDNQPLRGGKGSTWEGGIRTPFLVQWKSTLPAGTIYTQPVISLDVLPTALAAAGAQIDPTWALDGVNLLPFLKGESKGSPHKALYWRFGTQRAVRQGHWKMVQAREGKTGSIQIAKEGPVRLFHLYEDESEENDLAATFPEEAARLRRLWEQWAATLPEPAWKPGLQE